MSNSTVGDLYKYAALATAWYVRMRGLPLNGATFANEATNAERQAGGRLPLKLGKKLFVESATNPDVWSVLSYYGGDIPAAQERDSDRCGGAAILL